MCVCCLAGVLAFIAKFNKYLNEVFRSSLQATGTEMELHFFNVVFHSGGACKIKSREWLVGEKRFVIEYTSLKSPRKIQ